MASGEDELAQRNFDIKKENLQWLFRKPHFRPKEPLYATGVKMEKPSNHVKSCQHMRRVSSIVKGWAFGWEGTQNGTLYRLPGDQETGWYRLIGTVPTSSDCPCLRLLSVDSTDSNSTIKPPKPDKTETATKKKYVKQTMVGSCGKVLPALDKNLPPLVTPTVSEFHGQHRGQLCGDWCCTQIKELNVSVPDTILPHPKVYCQTVVPNNTSQETDRNKDKKGEEGSC